MVLRGMALMTLVNLAKAGVALLLSIMVARLVPPGEYGLVALAVTLLTLLTLLTDLGLASAVVRQPDLHERQAGAALLVLVLAAALAAGLLLAGARPLEQALGMAGLAPVLQGFSAVAAGSIAAVVPRALLERKLAYGRIAAVEGAAVAGGLLAFAAAAAAGLGILSLVAFHVALQLLRLAAFLLLSRRLFVPSLDHSGLRELIDVGGAVFAANLLSFCARNVDRLLIAAVLGSASLGLYAFAYQFMTLPLVLLTWPASGVLLAALSRLPADGAERPALILGVFTLTSALTFPLMGLLAFALEYPIAQLFGSAWDGAPELVATLAPAGAMQSLGSYCGAVLVSRRELRLNVLLSMSSALLLTACFAITVWMGIGAMAATYSATACLVCLLQLSAMCRHSGIGAGKLFNAVLPGLAGTLLGLSLVWVIFGTAPATRAPWLESVLLYVLVQVACLILARRRVARAVQAMRAVPGRKVPLPTVTATTGGAHA